ncbi:hypothetical protein CEE37_08385 [candidate division LCP-89 bacterium B3_LCP]|uniref:Uncharacterized protein n=1 Tax=candidate division LCP-89 bacterium B3_LCP TaxID=2012998 RepID=A0A532UZE9_UNCL8|nr:MAG: hypothetical protein CEE37_08385 [candidate division LCP-89 bacterium B3_LCP]
MKAKPVRICDISRILRISSTSLISFLQEKGYSVVGDFRSPVSSRMLELIQNGYTDGPPFKELDTMLPQAEEWEKQNDTTLNKLHTRPPKPEPAQKKAPEAKPKKYKPRKPGLIRRKAPASLVYTGRIKLTPIDLELIQRLFALEEPEKIKIRDHFRRNTILKAIADID